MLYEIGQINRWLAAHHGLPLAGSGLDVRLVGDVPDGEHVIPLGTSETPTRVAVRGGRIWIDTKEPTS